MITWLLPYANVPHKQGENVQPSANNENEVDYKKYMEAEDNEEDEDKEGEGEGDADGDKSQENHQIITKLLSKKLESLMNPQDKDLAGMDNMDLARSKLIIDLIMLSKNSKNTNELRNSPRKKVSDYVSRRKSPF